MGKNLSSKNWKRTSHKRYEAYISMPALGTKVLNKVTGEELVTDKGANFVVSTLDGDITLENASYIAQHFEFIDGSEIRPDTLKKRAVTINDNLYLDWIKVVSKSKVETLWAYYCDNEELANSLSNRTTVKGNVKRGYFLVCKDINGEPNTLSYNIESGKNFIYKYDLRAFPGVLKSYTDKEMELNKPSSLLDKSIEEKVNAISISREMSLKELANIFYNNLQIVKDEYSSKVLDKGAPYISKLGRPSIDADKRLIVCKNILKVNNLPFDYYSILQVSKTGICSISNTIDYKKVMGDLPKKAIFELEKRSIKDKTEEEISSILSIDFCDVYTDALKRVEYIALETIGPQMKYLTMLVDALRQVNNEADYELYDYHKKLEARYPYRARLSATLGENKINVVICMTEELENDFPIVAILGEDANNKKIRRTSLSLDESIMTVLSLFRSEDGYESMGNYIVKVLLKTISCDIKFRNTCSSPNDNTLIIKKCEVTQNELVLVDYTYNVILIGSEGTGKCRVIFDCNSSKNYIFTSSSTSSKLNVKCSFSGLMYKLIGLVCGQTNEMTNRTAKLYDLCTDYLKSLDLDFMGKELSDIIYDSKIDDFDNKIDVSHIHRNREYLYGRICQNKIEHFMLLNNIKFTMSEYFKIYEAKSNRYEDDKKTTKETVNIEFNLRHEGLLGNNSLDSISLTLVSNEISSKSDLKNKLDEYIFKCKELVDGYIQEFPLNKGCVVGAFSKNMTFNDIESIFISKYVLNCKEYIKENIKDFNPKNLKEDSFPIGKENYLGYSTWIEFIARKKNIKLVCCIRCGDIMTFEVKMLLDRTEYFIRTIELTLDEHLNFLNMVYEYRMEYDKYKTSELDTTYLIERFYTILDELIFKAKLVLESSESDEKPIRRLNQSEKIKVKSTKNVCEKLQSTGSKIEVTINQALLNLLANDNIKPLTEASKINNGLNIGLKYGIPDYNIYLIDIVYLGKENNEFIYQYTIYDYDTKEVLTKETVNAIKEPVLSMLDTVSVGRTNNKTAYDVDFKLTSKRISNKILQFCEAELKRGYDIQNKIIPESLDNLTEYKLKCGLDLNLTKVYSLFDKWGIVESDRNKYAEKIILALNHLFNALEKTKNSSVILSCDNEIEIDDDNIRINLDYTDKNIDFSEIDEDLYPFPYLQFEMSNSSLQICYIVGIYAEELYRNLPVNASEAEKQIEDLQKLCKKVLKDNMEDVDV